jgi:hypothetical protein
LDGLLVLPCAVIPRPAANALPSFLIAISVLVMAGQAHGRDRPHCKAQWQAFWNDMQALPDRAEAPPNSGKR